jgi:hypothetical protein
MCEQAQERHLWAGQYKALCCGDDERGLATQVVVVSVFDYSFERPALGDLGNVGVMRYFANDNQFTHGKILRSDELTRLHNAGLRVGLVWEHGKDQQTWDGREANRLADELGIPTWVPIYYALDLAPGNFAVIGAALDALPGPRPKGLYGGGPIVKWALDTGRVTFGWIANAADWSGVDTDHGHRPPLEVRADMRATAPNAHLLQLRHEDGPQLAGTDTNVVMNPNWGGWHPTMTQPPLEEEPVNAGTMVTPMDPKHPHHGEIWYVFEGTSMANWVSSPDMVNIYRFIGVAGPIEIGSEWFNNLTLLPHGQIISPFRRGDPGIG